MKSNHAQAAAEIRKWLKAEGIKATVRASAASMTSSVDIGLTDATPEVVAHVESFAKQFQQGHFDGMTDMYEYSNNRADIPQVKFVFVINEFTDELKAEAWSWLRANVDTMIEAPEDHKDARLYRHKSDDRMLDEYGDLLILRALNGVIEIGDVGRTFWLDRDIAILADAFEKEDELTDEDFADLADNDNVADRFRFEDADGGEINLAKMGNAKLATLIQRAAELLEARS